ncbi:MAG: DUF1080 domain-containing protein [Armatimonadetes bacterium CG_4_10_14_3_um_filter_66_18]|nr:DUF1080 domain-containing protein [Armatimonadota bacterium]OIO94370.1 MAG: glycosyl hydrolase [Armatimonadetes bacterium CG2_30_66_41]PIU90546.1 MAG: DUF1080 domain-containing protein [Armatimonadetes bacterium CG06_land_8_20_14_3_00_66_21]PIX36821.1 MAG: DUF1080 domain-containing protein [Armatimonadetes bacterium CG_4_8_14_3_um_filter_66_20]PIY50134.1 MAG: DUF1080 domain-containing protein [Armatimonadetes bacterium CG_4_10_14_3_um_filter_66_18]PIZ49280.1 MAG: DUF1080 domain-containing p
MISEPRRSTKAVATALILAGLAAGVALAETEKGFVSLFNGKDLTGWRGGKYEVEDGMLVCPKDGGRTASVRGGSLLTVKEYADFVLRFEFRLEPGGNNGVGIREPDKGNFSYDGIEIQILDNDAPKHANLRPAQYHGSIYDVVAAKRGATKPPGEWNREEILADGRQIKVTVNGQVIVDANLDDIKDPEVLKHHPGLARTTGRLGFLGHGDRVEFRNIRIKELKK